MERAAIQLQRRALSSARNDIPAASRAISQNPHLGCWGMAEKNIHAAHTALGWGDSRQAQCGWALRRYAPCGYAGPANVYRRTALPYDSVRHRDGRQHTRRRLGESGRDDPPIPGGRYYLVVGRAVV